MGGERIALEKVSFAATKGSNNIVFTGKNNSCAILDKFERQEKASKEKTQKLKVNTAVKAMQKAFGEYLKKERLKITAEDGYGLACEQVESLAVPYSAGDIGLFSVALVQFQEEKLFALRAGYFLSALMNQCTEKKFTISTEHLSIAIHAIGYRNTKNITVNGNVGSYMCEAMEDGTMTVNGNVENAVGAYMKNGAITVNGNVLCWAGKGMEGGKITVNGNVNFSAGWKMKGGEIIVNGDAGTDTGEEMKGGSVRINGNIEGVSESIEGGDIYQKGRQIVKNGERTAEKLNK